MSIGMLHIRGLESKMKTPEVYQPVGERLALFCQSDQKLFPEMLSYNWFPDVLNELGHGWGNVSTNYASIEMGGGFHHFGYRLELDSATTTPLTNRWRLFMCSEGSDDKLLTTIALSSSQHLTANEIQKLAESGYSKSIADNPNAYEGKILTLLRFGKMTEAKEACDEWVKLQPDYWLPHFTLAHVRCRLGESEAASKEFSEWVKEHPNFAYYNYLALFYYREGNTNEALKAVQLSQGQPFIEPPNTDGNKFFLGFNGAMIFYLAGDYDSSLAACNRMLSDSQQENWWRRKILKLKAANLLNKGDQASALQSLNEAVKLQDKTSFGLEGMQNSDNFLRKAIEAKDVSAVAGCGPWLDEMESWFTPFDANEAGFYGGQDIPNPFPKSWKSDNMRPDEVITNAASQAK